MSSELSFESLDRRMPPQVALALADLQTGSS
jgi:hypothetical protein